METLKKPEGWNDLDMDWNDPDPLKSCYYDAILAAIDERVRAFAISNTRWYYYDYRIHTRNRSHIPSAETIQRLARLIFALIKDTGSILYIKEKFLNDETSYSQSPPSRKDMVNPVLTYPVIIRGEPLTYAKEFLIWAKKTLDTMTMFGKPCIKINYHAPEEYDSINEHYYHLPELEGVEDEKKRLEITANLFIQNQTDNIVIKSDIFQNFDLILRTYADASNASASITIQLPESIVVRSFARPHIYCMIKPMPVTGTYNWYFNDFGYGFEEETNKVLDLGQLSDEKDKKIDLFQFELKRTRPNICAGDGFYNEFRARCYFALDYNIDGGFKFRPDA